MPVAATRPELVVPVASLARVLTDLVEMNREDEHEFAAAGARELDFEALLEFLKSARGVDLLGHERPSLERRVRRRLDVVGVGTYADYLEFLEAHPEEFPLLFDAILIDVTGFFRDPPVWQLLQERVLPDLVLDAPEEPIRAWSAGCASGQEAFSLAMVLAEVLGEDVLRERVKIYATDVDEGALSIARLASYSSREVESVPAVLRERYFEPVGGRFAFRTDLRRAVTFGRHDLVEDAPISRLSLVLCRNTVMYFTAETQKRVLDQFHSALGEGGVLVLGRSELGVAHRRQFSPVDLKRRVFRRRGGIAARPGPELAAPVVEAGGTAASQDELSAAALEIAGIPQLVISRAGTLALANSAARVLLGLKALDVGRPYGELDLAVRATALREALEQALREGRTVALGQTTFASEDGPQSRVEVTVAPLLAGGTPLGASVTLEDVTRVEALREEVAGNRRDLELAYEELQSTLDELETTNEELQSTNEELETTNEELRSTNEELETMDEALPSTNEELETMHDELRDRTLELDVVNHRFEAILATLGVAVGVLDSEGRVREWSRRAEGLWGVRAEAVVRQHLLALDIGLPVERLGPALRQVLAGATDREELVLDAVDRRGRTFACRTTILSLSTGPESRGGGAVVAMLDAAAGSNGGSPG